MNEDKVELQTFKLTPLRVKAARNPAKLTVFILVCNIFIIKLLNITSIKVK